MAKEAAIFVITMAIECPHCYENAQDPEYGSFRWEVSKYPPGTECKCSECGEKFEIPEW